MTIQTNYLTEIDNYKRTSEKLFASAGIQPQSKFIATNGPVKNVHYYEIGTGKPLVLIHGGGFHAAQWYPLIKSLREKFHLFIPDRPGCGLTDTFNYRGVDIPSHGVDFVRSFMDAVGIDNARFAGYSMGALFIVNFALKYPNRVEKILLLGHPAGGTQHLPVLVRLMGMRGVNTLLQKVIGTPNKKNTKQFYKQLLVADHQKLSEDFLENDVYAQLLPGSAKSFVSLIENFSDLSGFKKSYLIGSRMKELNMPVCFIIGDKDKFDTLDNVRRIVAEMKNGEMEVVKGGGHVLFLDEPAECNRLMLQHLI